MKEEKKIRVLEDEYLTAVQCTNCKRNFTAAIKKGYTIEDSLSTDPTCPNCGCRTLVAVEVNK